MNETEVRRNMKEMDKKIVKVTRSPVKESLEALVNT